MDDEILKKVEQLAAITEHLFIATSDARGWPHVAAAGRLAITPEKHAIVTEWFCSGTVANLQANPRLSMVIWDPVPDIGYQIIGELEEIKDIGVLDGYVPGRQQKVITPQVERQLLVHIDKIFEFRRAPHSDVEA